MTPPAAPASSRPLVTRHTVVIVLLVIALLLFVAGLVCAAVPRVIFGAGWDVWVISAFIALVLAWLVERLN